MKALLVLNEAISREKQLKGGSRQKKVNLIVSKKPNWNDVSNLIEPYQ